MVLANNLPTTTQILKKIMRQMMVAGIVFIALIVVVAYLAAIAVIAALAAVALIASIAFPAADCSDYDDKACEDCNKVKNN